MQVVDPRLRARRLDDRSVGVIQDLLARRGEKCLIQLRADSPRRALYGHGFIGGEFETDEAAGGCEEVGHAFGPLGSCFGGEGAEELREH